MPFLKHIPEYTDSETSEPIPEVLIYPYNTRSDYTNTSFPAGSSYPEFNVYWVYPTAQSNPDPTNLKAEEATPVYSVENERWEQAWNYVAKTAEELRLEKYNPAAFLQAMFADSTFETWMANFSTFKQSGFLDSTTNAKVDNNWSVVQAIYDSFKAVAAPSNDDIVTWQGVADLFGVPLVF